MTHDNTVTGQLTALPDRDYLLIRFIDMSLSNALRCDTYLTAAERDGDTELAALLRRARTDSYNGGEAGKTLLAHRLHPPDPHPQSDSCSGRLPTHSDM